MLNGKIFDIELNLFCGCIQEIFNDTTSLKIKKVTHVHARGFVKVRALYSTTR